MSSHRSSHRSSQRSSRPSRRAVAVAAAVALALVTAGCGNGGNGGNGGSGSAAPGGDRCAVAIGFFGALTGDAANLGKNILDGAQLAVEKYNAARPNCTVTLARFDSQGSPDQAPGLASQAINDPKVVGIVGPTFSGESKAANPLFDEAGMPLVTPSATSKPLADNGWKVFHRVVGNDATQGPAAGRYIRTVLKPQKVFVVDDATEYGKGLAGAVRTELGGLVAGSDTVQTKQTDFAATVTKIKASGATVLFYGGYFPEAGLLRKQLTEAGGQGVTLVAGDGVRDPGFVTGAGRAAAEGTVVTCPCNPPDKVGGTFYPDFTARYSSPPGTYAAEAFDAANVLLDGIDAGHATRASLLDWVNRYDKDGVTKRIKFDARGEPSDAVVWAYTVKDGAVVPVQEIA